MELTAFQEDVYAGKICPYCKSKTIPTTEEAIYGKSYKGRTMICCVNYPECDSYVGTHKDDGSALGRLANKELRQYKKVAHDSFDRIWQEEHCDRDEAYEHMSNALNIPLDYTHIGMFNIETCKKAITWANQVYKDLKIESKRTEELFEFVEQQKIKEQNWNIWHKH